MWRHILQRLWFAGSFLLSSSLNLYPQIILSLRQSRLIFNGDKLFASFSLLGKLLPPPPTPNTHAHYSSPPFLCLPSQVEISRVTVLCSLLNSLLCGRGDKTAVDFTMDPAKLHPLICTTFVFAYVWSLGGNLIQQSMDAFDSFCRDLFSDTHDVKVWDIPVHPP